MHLGGRIISGVATAIAGSAVIGGLASSSAARKQADAANNATAISDAQYRQTREDQTPWRDAGTTSLRELQYLLGISDGKAPVEENQGTFDPAAYLAANQDVANDAYYGSRPYQHYLDYGQGEGRKFTPTQAAKDATEPASHTGAFGSLSKSFTLADFQKDPGYDFRMQEGQKALERSAAARGGLQGGGTLKALTRYGQDYASNEYGNAYNRWNNDNTTRFNRLASLAQVGQTANNTIAQAGQANASNANSNVLAAGNARASGYVGTANAINSGLNNSMSLYMMNQMFQNRSALTKDPAADPKWGGAYAGFNNPDNYG